MHILSADFSTRREAEMAIERLVQTHGLDRATIRVRAEGLDNSAGVAPAGADVKRGDPAPAPAAKDEPALNGPVRLEVIAPFNTRDAIEATLAEFGGRKIYGGTASSIALRPQAG
jgi:hypothetical protein